MPLEVRPITPDELTEFLRVDSLTFGETFDPQDVETVGSTFDYARSVATFDRGRIVGTAGGYGFQLTLPGARQIPVHGVSWVGVLPTHRRRGILRTAMQRQFTDMRERGEAVAILLASESSIYGRFGFGPATVQREFEIDPRYGALERTSPGSGSVEVIDRETAAQSLPPIYDRMFQQQPGAINRTESHWREDLRDPERWRRGASELFYVIHRTDSGEADGYAYYRIRSHWEHGLPAYTLILVELVALTVEAHAALWAFCMSVDLVARVEVKNRPVDDSIQWMLADQRRLHTTLYADFLWARLLDIPAALSARAYGSDGSLVLEIFDPFCPDNSGRYRLQGGIDGQECRRTEAEPNLVLDVADLGALFLGGVAATTLHRAGRIHERTPGSVRLADAMFLAHPAPWCITEF